MILMELACARVITMKSVFIVLSVMLCVVAAGIYSAVGALTPCGAVKVAMKKEFINGLDTDQILAASLYADNMIDIAMIKLGLSQAECARAMKKHRLDYYPETMSITMAVSMTRDK